MVIVALAEESEPSSTAATLAGSLLGRLESAIEVLVSIMSAKRKPASITTKMTKTTWTAPLCLGRYR